MGPFVGGSSEGPKYTEKGPIKGPIGRTLWTGVTGRS
jgi:hypothetical protein